MVQHDLQQFQSDFKKSVLTGEPHARLVNNLVASGELPSVNRLNIHRNNYLESLSSNLAGLFPALEAFVGKDFVKGALKEFCNSNPPITAFLAHYGAEFADFLHGHSVSEQLPYVSDIVRLEWAMHELQIQQEVSYCAEPKPDADISISENIRIIDSDYPLMSIWSAAMGHIPAEAIHLDQGGQMVVALLNASEVSLMALDRPEAQLLRSIQSESDDGGEDEASVVSAAQNLFSKRVLVAQ